MAADAEIEDAVRGADPERWLATRFIADAVARRDVLAIYAFDHQLARAGRVASTSLVAEIRLTWWLEALDEIFDGRVVRAHPVVQALAEAVRRRDLSRDLLTGMIATRLDQIDLERLTEPEALIWARDIAGASARLAAQVLDPAGRPDAAGPAGELWGVSVLAGQGAVDRDWAAKNIGLMASAARVAARRLGVAAFPAIAHAALARGRLRPAPLSDAERRLRLIWAVASGRV